MKLPRDIKGYDLAKAFAKFGYEINHQTGSHIRLTTREGGEHHITIPAHDYIHVGTLNAILRDIGKHHKLNRKDLLKELLI